MIVYEYPFNELVRSMLRLEYLFARFNHFLRSDDPELHHNAISILFDLGDIGARGDIKSLLLKEFERQKYALNGLKSSQKVDQEALSQTLAEIDSVASKINQSAGRPNLIISESEWLNGIRTRLNIPGGTSPIDLPSYHAWKNSPSPERRKLLENFVSPLLPWQDACQLFLRLLRQSGEAKDVVAHNGSFQQAPSGKVYQLMRIAVEDDTLFSEISANKYLLSVRFMQSDRDKKAQPAATDVPFKLTLCQF
ncbi:cell division protein ZapD [Polynucleobacter sp. QLW-P1DATA-2]|uniref:cell division protein ZapD n=1 Tax=unclassified Polynucleobacter TaxID=2640945 RepID=UPI0008F936A0|nr:MULTISPECIES: cell division protein ZapD [unclassified Polynucleobacter]OIN00787.1 cell division protein ZapD [Polynucleobacter sp. QLW-P1DATA-2]OIN02351.1 cell division protein ZapD [Polynucleobacter sp. MWH-Tro8-2-5-gr]